VLARLWLAVVGLTASALLVVVPAAVASSTASGGQETRATSAPHQLPSWRLKPTLRGDPVPGEQLTATGAHLEGGARRVFLQRRVSSAGASWSTVASATSTRRGTFRLVTRAAKAGLRYAYRIHAPSATARSAGRSHRYPAWTSEKSIVEVRPQTIQLQLPSTAQPGATVTGSVVTDSPFAGRPITIQARVGDGPWSTKTMVYQSKSPTTSFQFNAASPLPGQAPVTESVRAVAGAFHTVPSVTSTAQTVTVDPGPDNTPPPTPTLVSVENGDQQVTLSWIADTTWGLAGYTVYESGAYDGPWTEVNSTLITANHYTVTGLTNNTLYFFRVSASNTSGAESAKSDYAAATPVVYRSDWAQISAGVTHTCGLRDDGTVWCWGDTYPMWSQFPAQVGTDHDWVSVSSGDESACGLKVDHTLWCWGNNNVGQLGDGTRTSTQNPVQVGTGNDWASVSAGNFFTCGIRADSTAWCWGVHLDGYFSSSSDVPVQVGSDSDWASISAGTALVCGLHTDGTAWCWGTVADSRVPDGSLGDGKTLTSDVPIPIWPGYTFASLATDGMGACAVLTNGTGVCWGHGWAGQLGTGRTDSGLTPQIVDPNHWGPGYQWLSIQGGAGGVTCGLRPDHTLWCWGGVPSQYASNPNYIGNGTATGSTLPVQIGSDDDWVSVGGQGGGHTCALRSNGTAWCWGSNSQLALGDNPLSDSLVPARVAG